VYRAVRLFTSQRWSRCQIILLGYRGTCVNNLPKVVTRQCPGAESNLRLWVTSRLQVRHITVRLPGHTWLGSLMVAGVGWQVTLCDPVWQVTLTRLEMSFYEELCAPFNLFAWLTHIFVFVCAAGVAQGVITGIRSLCYGLGPALFGFVFYLFHVDVEKTDIVIARPVTHNVTSSQDGDFNILQQINKVYCLLSSITWCTVSSHESYRLLQWSIGWCTEGGDWQAASHNELGSTSLQTHGSLTMVCRTSDMKSYTGWMYQSVSRSSYACLSTSVCMEWDRHICWEMCLPISSLPGRRHLRSAVRGQLAIPRYRLTTAGRRAFSFAGPSAWNSLPTYLNDHTLNMDSFKRFLKSFLFQMYW